MLAMTSATDKTRDRPGGSFMRLVSVGSLTDDEVHRVAALARGGVAAH